MKRVCTKCGVEKDIENFYKDKQKLSGYRPDCKVCNSERSTKWIKNNKEKHYGYNLKGKYGIDIKRYKEILVEQGNKCAICLKDISQFKSRLHVDHNHNSKKIRGLLCVNCNHGIGSFMEDTNLLNNAIKYLNKWD